MVIGDGWLDGTADCPLLGPHEDRQSRSECCNTRETNRGRGPKCRQGLHGCNLSRYLSELVGAFTKLSEHLSDSFVLVTQTLNSEE